MTNRVVEHRALDQVFVDGLTPGDRQEIYFDTLTPGLFVRVGKRVGVEYWYRSVRGENRSQGLAKEVTLEEARRAAREDRALNPPRRRGPGRAGLVPTAPEPPTPLIEVPPEELPDLERRLRQAAENFGQDLATYGPDEGDVVSAFQRFVAALDPDRTPREPVPGQLVRYVLDVKKMPHGLTHLQQDLLDLMSRPLTQFVYTPPALRALECVRTAQLTVADEIVKGALVVRDGDTVRRAYVAALVRVARFSYAPVAPDLPAP